MLVDLDFEFLQILLWVGFPRRNAGFDIFEWLIFGEVGDTVIL